MEFIESRQYKHITFGRIDQDTIFFKYGFKIEIDLSIAKEMVSDRLDYTQGKAVYALIDFTNVKSVTKEARYYMNDPEGGLKGILGGAFLSNNVVTTLFVNLYLKVSHPIIPARFFTSKEDALDWLKKIKAERTHVTAEL